VWLIQALPAAGRRPHHHGNWQQGLSLQRLAYHTVAPHEHSPSAAAVLSWRRYQCVECWGAAGECTYTVREAARGCWRAQLECTSLHIRRGGACLGVHHISMCVCVQSCRLYTAACGNSQATSTFDPALRRRPPRVPCKQHTCRAGAGRPRSGHGWCWELHRHPLLFLLWLHTAKQRYQHDVYCREGGRGVSVAHVAVVAAGCKLWGACFAVHNQPCLVAGVPVCCVPVGYQQLFKKRLQGDDWHTARAVVMCVAVNTWVQLLLQCYWSGTGDCYSQQRVPAQHTAHAAHAGFGTKGELSGTLLQHIWENVQGGGGGPPSFLQAAAGHTCATVWCALCRPATGSAQQRWSAASQLLVWYAGSTVVEPACFFFASWIARREAAHTGGHRLCPEMGGVPHPRRLVTVG
jgi:hypothetical protein